MNKRRLKRRLNDATRKERCAVEERHRMAREADRLRLALEAVAQPLVVRDEAGHVVLRNGCGPERAVTGPGAPLVDAAIGQMIAAAADSEPVTRTLELRGPPPRQLVLTATPLRRGDEGLGTITVVDDVSERRQLEAVRRDFVANVSHELRTPVGALALLGEALSGETDPVVISRLADRITAEADRASRMIEDLLDLSRIEGGGPMTRRAIPVEGLVVAAVERVRPAAGLREVALVTECNHPPGLTIGGDEAQLVSAVANLVDNAVKYSDARSAVHVRTDVADACVEIAVCDRGIGIPARDLERIFERFYRVDRARSRETGGTGLGLSIVRHVATNHHGEVSVRSVEGDGSTFTLRLPVEGVDGPDNTPLTTLELP